MTKYLITISLITLTITCLAQEIESDCLNRIDTLSNREVYTVVDILPEPVEGMSKLYERVIKTLIIPKGFHPIESKVIIAFVVEQDGSITGMRTIKNITGTTFDTQLMELIATLEWNPGTCNGEQVSTLILLPVIIDFN